MHLRLPYRRKAALVAVVATLAIIATGCASGSGPHHSDDAPKVDVAALLGPPDKATGSPVTIGYLTDGRSASVDVTAAQQAAKATVKYVNEHLGGVAGHPIKLFICETKQLPADAAGCANQMVDRNVPVVLNDVTGVGKIAVPPIIHAGIPYITWSAASSVELTNKLAYSVTGSLVSSIGGVAAYLKEKGVTKVAVLAIDLPAVTQTIHAIGVPAFKKAGISLKVVAIPPGTPDLSAQVQSAISSEAGAIFIEGDKTICAAGIKSARSLGYTGKMFTVYQCIEPETAESIPGGYDGVLTPTTVKMKNGSHEYDLYKAVLRKYSPETADANIKSGTAVEGYGAVLAFARAMKSMKDGPVTAKRISSAMANAKDIKMPVGGKSTFTCAGSEIPRFPSICSTNTWVTELDSKGTPVSYTEVDPAPLFR